MPLTFGFRPSDLETVAPPNGTRVVLMSTCLHTCVREQLVWVVQSTGKSGGPSCLFPLGKVLGSTKFGTLSVSK